MTRATKTKTRKAGGGSFIVDKGYIRGQAAEAIALFLTPVSGVYRAALGKRTRLEGKPNSEAKAKADAT